MLSNKELKRKLLDYTNPEWIENGIPFYTLSYEELMDLIKEVCESIVPDENDEDRKFDNRIGCIREIKDNIKNLFKDE